MTKSQTRAGKRFFRRHRRRLPMPLVMLAGAFMIWHIVGPAQAQGLENTNALTTQLSVVANYADPQVDPQSAPILEAPPLVEAPEGYWSPTYNTVTLAGGYTRRRDVGVRDRRAYPLGPRAFIVQMSNAGFGPEGHATLIFARREGDQYVIDYALGQFANNSHNQFANSWPIYQPRVNRLCIDNADCMVQHDPASIDVELYRQNRITYFGVIPHRLATQIFSESRSATYAIVDQTYYYAALDAATRINEQPYIVTSQNHSTALRHDLRSLLEIYCMNVWLAFCTRHQPDYEYAQTAFSETHSWPYLGRSGLVGLYELDRYTSATSSPRYRIDRSDTVNGLTGNVQYSGEATVCPDVFSSDRDLSHRDINTRAVSYRGGLLNGFAHGAGTIYFTSRCDYVESQDPRVTRLVGTFEEGYLTGRAEYYSFGNRIVWTGDVLSNSLNGVSTFFDPSGSEIATATYTENVIQRSSLRFFELDYVFQALPFRPMRLFDASQIDENANDGDPSGSWSPLTRIIQNENLTIAFDGSTLSSFHHQDKIEIEGDYTFTPGEIGYEYAGEVRMYEPDGTIFDFEIEDGEIVGVVRVFVPAVGYWQTSPIGPDQQIRYLRTLPERRSRGGGFWDDVRAASNGDFRPFVENVEDELGRWGQAAIRPITSAGREFERFMCRVTGTEEGRSCTVGVGGSIGTDGPTLLDGTGQVVEQGRVEPTDWAAIFDWQIESEMSDFDLQELVGDNPMWSEIAGLSVFRAPASPDSGGWLGLHARAPTLSGAVRGRDVWGSGHLGTGRTNSGHRYIHNGTDFIAEPGELILAPIDGVVTVARIDGSNIRRNFIQIRHADGRTAELTYVRAEGVREGDIIARGTPIGRAIDLRPTYPGITNHVHVQYGLPGGEGGRGYWTSPDGTLRFSKP